MDEEEPRPHEPDEKESEESLRRRRSDTIARLRRHLAEQSRLLGVYGGSDPENRRAMRQVERDIEETLKELDALHEALHMLRQGAAGGRLRSFVLETRIPEERRNSPEYLELTLLRHCASDHTDLAHFDRAEVLATLQRLLDEDHLRRTWKVTPSANGGFDGKEVIERTDSGTERLHELERILTAGERR